ncbi:hypothetical protein K505DRAFT_308528 [Melanomma pulvis-pyrius CBS 109.77]|uniref:Vacuolar protein sorting-associated protein 62 n=1 Tax=Melanomma pulvis-pyrius CBS 109.77 TaxID=1314802 RepID=A0A6A6X776_9PLEO|nr:hypothetical protein K505DRAFT_308528 [Melanomma pulvis-pyrius CBS 109.77]
MADIKGNGVRKTAVPEGVPQYVLDHAPLLHLSTKDPYLPSSLAAHLTHTRPQIAFADTAVPSPPPTLSNLDQLNTVGSNGGTDVYLSSYDDITTNPKWVEGIMPDENGGTGDEKTSAIIVVEKGYLDGKEKGKVVDVFYFYFWSFNWGGVVLGNQLGDHVGDWEHNMIRFVDGAPKYVWYSQHANGEAYTFAALKKDAAGKRPLVYAANGSHALYPTPGTHDHTLPNLNLPFALLLVDDTDPGPLYDPILTSYYYTYTPPPPATPSSTGTPAPALTPFTPFAPNDPISYLTFRGRWGDAEFPAADARQRDLLGNKKFVGGPTGPADKGLERREVWPESQWSGGQRIRGGLGVGGLGARVGAVLGRLSCFGRKGGARRVWVSGEEVG